MGWGSKTQIITSQAVSGSEVFSSAVTLYPGEVAHVQVEADFPASPTDSLDINVYGTLDDTSEDWDSDPINDSAYNIPNTVDPGYKSIQVSGFYKFRIGVKRNGSTDTITVNAYVKKDGANIS